VDSADARGPIAGTLAVVPYRAPIPDELRGRPFTAAMAERAGVPSRRLRNSSYRRMYRDVYVVAGEPECLHLRCQAALLALPPGSALSHDSVLEVTGLCDGEPGGVVHVSTQPGTWRPRTQPGLVVHERSDAFTVVTAQGLPATGPARTLVDVAPSRTPDELVVVSDHLLRRMGGLDAMVAGLAAEAGRRHVRQAREAVTRSREGVDSPPETWLRLAIVAYGLPEPEVNLLVKDRAGEWLGRSELGYRRFRILIQYEGDDHRTNPRRWRQDIARDESYMDEDWRVLRATADDVNRPRNFCNRVEREIERAIRRQTPRDLGGTAA